MSNLISHPKQGATINLDNVASIRHRLGKSTAVTFLAASFGPEHDYVIDWNFSSVEEAGEVYSKILDRFVTEI